MQPFSFYYNNYNNNYNYTSFLVSSPVDADLVVIGSGPGGYVAAIKAAQLGLKVSHIFTLKPTISAIIVNNSPLPVVEFK